MTGPAVTVTFTSEVGWIGELTPEGEPPPPPPPPPPIASPASPNEANVRTFEDVESNHPSLEVLWEANLILLVGSAWSESESTLVEEVSKEDVLEEISVERPSELTSIAPCLLAPICSCFVLPLAASNLSDATGLASNNSTSTSEGGNFALDFLVCLGAAGFLTPLTGARGVLSSGSNAILCLPLKLA